MNRLKRFQVLFSVCSLFYTFTLWAEDASCAALSLEQKVGQLFMVHTHGTVAGEEARVLIEDLHIGGVIYYNWSNQLDSPDQVADLSASLQKIAKVPLFIATDQEGGLVSRLSKGGFTQFPGNMALAAAGSSLLCEEVACAMGEEMEACGVNMDLAPVADVNCEPTNPVIGVRSFGDDVDKVTACARSMLKGFSQGGIIPVLKHFPGYGDVKVDPHYGLPKVDKSRQELDRVELYPFRALCRDADVIMTAHILVPALDPKNCATVSYPIVTELLRNEMGYKGVVITDSMVMQGVIDACDGDVDTACFRAFEAGSDIILLGGKDLQRQESELTLSDITRIIKHFQQRVEEGGISMERLDASVDRILALKKKIQNRSNFSFFAHPEESRRVVENSITELRPGALDLKDKTVCLIAPRVCTAAAKHNAVFYDQGALSETSRAEVLEKAQAKDAVIVLTYNAWKNSEEQALLREIAALKKPYAVIALRDPYDVNVVPEPVPVLATYSTLPASLEAALEVLYGRAEAKGECPVKIPKINISEK